MKRNTAIAAIAAALLIGSGAFAQGYYNNNSQAQLRQYGFSNTAQSAVYGGVSANYSAVSADVAESEMLPPITMSDSSNTPKQMSLPPITACIRNAITILVFRLYHVCLIIFLYTI